MILHIVPALFGENDGIVGGAERYVFELARHMAAATPTRLLSFGTRDREERVGDLQIRVIGGPWYIRGQRANPLSLRMLGELRRAHVIHCHQQHILASTLSGVVGRLLGRGVYCTEMGGGGFDLSAYVSTDQLYRGHLHISQYSRRIAGHDNKPWAHVIYGGVDTVKFSPSQSTPRDGGVLFVGRLLPHKGVDVLIGALPDDLPARIVGPAPDARYLTDLRLLAQGKRVTFHHDLDDEGLVDAYRRALCIVLPSVYDDVYGGHSLVPELLGQTILEGMACGLPAVCTRVASLPEIVEPGVTGTIVPPRDIVALRRALVELASNPSAAAEMGRAARSRVVERFNWRAIVDQCLTIYAARGVAQNTPSATLEVTNSVEA